MKKAITYIISVFLGCLIFYGGAGINLVSYCCGDCRSAGVDVVLIDKCCEIHDHTHAKESHSHNHSCHHHATTHENENCTEHLEATDCCDLARMEFEWNNTVTPIQQPAPVEMDLSLFGWPSLLLLTSLDNYSQVIEGDRYGPPLIVCPRTYLSLLTTLLI